MASRDNVIEAARIEAAEAGIPLELLIACGIAESNLRADARRPTSPSEDAAYWPDVSFGPWQQTVRWAPEYAGGSAYPGPAEVERVGRFYLDPLGAARTAAANLAPKWRQYAPDVLRTLFAYNWPAGGGRAASAGHEANYRRGLAEAQEILGSGAAPTPALVYDRDYPSFAQNDQWSCAPTSLRWAMHAFGRRPTEAWIEGAMLSQGVVSQSQGLLDASGVGLAAFVRREYGEFGYDAWSIDSVNFDDVWSKAGTSPVLLGGRRWGSGGHWSGVRGHDAGVDRLLLANPAPGHGGVQQTMTRQQFNVVSPCSMVVVTHASAAPIPVPTPTDPRDAIIAQLRAEVAARDEKIGGLISAVGYLADRTADRLGAEIAEAQRVRVEQIGVRP